MAARDLVVKWFGEGVARKVEQFVDGIVFDDDLVICPECRTLVAVTLITERGECQICQATVGKEMMIEILEVRRQAALAAGLEANNEVAEIDRRLLAVRSK